MYLFKQKTTKWTMQEQSMLLRRLSDLLDKGYSLWHALEFLQFHLRTKQKEQLQHAVEQLKAGRSLHSVFWSLQFHTDILGYLFYAEQHGDLAFALREGSILLERKYKHQQAMQKALRYPLFLCVFLMGIVFVFNMVLFPQFSSLYQSLQTKSSSLANGIFSFLQTLPYALVGIIVILAIVALWYMLYFRKLPPITRMNMCMKVPILKAYCRAVNSHYFSMQLSSLLQGGLSVLDALVLMEKQKHQSFFQWEAQQMKQFLTEGENLDYILQSRPYYEAELSYVVTHGQASGNLAKELTDYSEMIVERLESTINRAVLIVQPLLFTTIGVIVILMYLAMLLPMFTMMNSM
ncbi:competence type IV pilus assembly protein ComGB [Microbacteriaceae bacterium 4G12]